MSDTAASSVRPSRGGAAALPLIAAALFVALYAPVVAPLAKQWLNDPNYQHGLAVPVVSAYILWRRRAALQAAAGPKAVLAGSRGDARRGGAPHRRNGGLGALHGAPLAPDHAHRASPRPQGMGIRPAGGVPAALSLHDDSASLYRLLQAHLPHADHEREAERATPPLHRRRGHPARKHTLAPHLHARGDRRLQRAEIPHDHGHAGPRSVRVPGAERPPEDHPRRVARSPSRSRRTRSASR